MGEPGGDAVIAGMIQFAIAVAEEGFETVYRDIEDASGIAVGIKPVEDLFEVEDEIERIKPGEGLDGYLVGLCGTNRLPGNTRYIEGIALTTDSKDKEQFTPVGILENGAVFALCEELN